MVIKQGKLIKNEIFNCIYDGMRTKKEIYDRVCENLGVARPTVRRSAADLITELEHILKILKVPGKKK